LSIAKRPGSKKAAAPAAQTSATVVQPANVAPDEAEAGTDPAESADSDLGLEKPEPPVKGLAIARRPGSKRAAAPKPAEDVAPQPEPEAAPAAVESAPEPEPEPASEPAAAATPAEPEAPVKGLGIAPGVRRPGKR